MAHPDQANRFLGASQSGSDDASRTEPATIFEDARGLFPLRKKGTLYGKRLSVFVMGEVWSNGNRGWSNERNEKDLVDASFFFPHAWAGVIQLVRATLKDVISNCFFGSLDLVQRQKNWSSTMYVRFRRRQELELLRRVDFDWAEGSNRNEE